MKMINKSPIALCVALCCNMPIAFAQSADKEKEDSLELETIMVTAQKRTQNVQEVPISVAALTAKELDVLGSSGMDIRSLSFRIPSLLIESSFGRSFPRFYIRGLGNTDFDLLASQPVSLIYDDVVLENSLIKGYPMFDVQQTEVLRGPQGTLFGRNTPAGIVKIDSVKPSQDFDAHLNFSYGSYNTTDFDAAIGGGITDTLSFRASLLMQDRDDYINNKAPGFEQEDVLGGFDERSGRFQLLWEPNADLNILAKYHFRDADSDARLFRANIIKPGTNELVDDFDFKTIYQDAASRNRQDVDTDGWSLKINYDLGDYTFTSITGYESARMLSVGDIDGGYGASFLPESGPGLIPFPSETGSAMPDHEQYTQEVRLATNELGEWDYQVGFFIFEEEVEIENLSFDTLADGVLNGLSRQFMDTSAWAVFGSVDWEYSDRLTITAGLRYSDDEREWDGELITSPIGLPSFSAEADVDDSQVSWDLSASYKYSDETNIYGRIARGYRAPSIQGRDLLFSGPPSTADSETMVSIETGFKTRTWGNRARINGSVYYYEVSDQQLTAVGGSGNLTSLLNADESVGYGFELDGEAALSESWFATAGLSYNHTEIKQDGLAVDICGAPCTIKDPISSDGRALIDGNPLPQAPEWIANVSLRYTKEVGEGNFFVYTDWAYRSEVNFFLYESVEFRGKGLTEGGLRVGYEWFTENAEYEVALFGRNITNQQKLTGAIDFNNLTGFVNERQFWGVEFISNFF
ncbi:TonB-dependent receptor [Alteromonas sp. a30]|uniref:TonB-dependent receptor n=1 Tax=Alteromonas sp. a30 TaxID=2730917 RepID=UPI002280EDD8|nr:TonB-dependent receptor [Alteromonas sp. a30]MCY7296420.1 TonB-dependent receptor [Alteromonas sp. a30]